jgi:uncharacterized membrane protein (DUF373 family)
VNGRGPLIGGIVLIAIGAFFLLRELVPGLSWSDLWPWASIAFGVLLLVLSFRPARGV